MACKSTTRPLSDEPSTGGVDQKSRASVVAADAGEPGIIGNIYMDYTTLLKTTLGILIFGTASLTMAATPPDAGQTLQQMQSVPPPATPEKPAPTLTNEIPATEAQPAGRGETVHVTHLMFRGNTAFDSEVLSRVAHIENADVTLQDMRSATHRISQYYRQHGYLVARAYVPPQDITGGVITIVILEGKLGGLTLHNRSDVDDSRVRKIVAGQMPTNAPVNSAGTNRALLLLQKTPGISDVQGSLQPGPDVGTTALTVVTKAAPVVSGNVAADNYGSSFTGKNRLSGNLIFSNLTSEADQLSLQGILTDHDGLDNGRIAWDFPVRWNGMRLGVAWSHTRYELGKQFAALDAHGTASISSLYATYPLVLTPTTQVNGNVSMEWRELNDTTGALAFDDRKAVTATVLTLSGNFADTALVMPATNEWKVAATFGDLDLHTPSVAAMDAITAHTAGHYQKAVVRVSREQSLIGNLAVYVSGVAQRSDGNLDSSEQFFLGGPNGIRAYPIGEAPGDQGWQGTLELRYGFLRRYQVVGFHDLGMIEANHTPYINQQNGRHLSGSGVGLNGNWTSFSFKTALAWRGGKDAPTSDTDKRPRFWLQGAYAF